MSSDVVSENAELTIDEICERSQVSVVVVTSYVEHGLIEVDGVDPVQWRFSEACVVQIEKAYRLEQDLGINPAGVVLAFELLAQIDDLQRRLKRLEKEE